MMTQEQKHTPFGEGQSTRPDVDLLLKAFPEMPEGMEITDDEIAEVIGLSRDDNYTRFTTIENAWKSAVMQHGIVLERVRAANRIKVLSVDEIAGRRTHDSMRFAVGKLRRTRREVTSKSANSDADRQRLVQAASTLYSIEEFARSERKKLGLPAPQPVVLPKTEES